MNRIALAIGGLAIVGVAAWLLSRQDDPPAPAPVDDQPEISEPEFPAETGIPYPDPVPLPEGLPAEFYVDLAPGEEIPITIPPGLTSGIRCPDGTYLPPLNGCPVGGPIARNRSRMGELPPVVAKMCDGYGLEWYVHADGSRTTTTWKEATVHGEAKMMVATLHFGPYRSDEQTERKPGSGSAGTDPEGAVR
jgi:hypothetical protein